MLVLSRPVWVTVTRTGSEKLTHFLDVRLLGQNLLRLKEKHNQQINNEYQDMDQSQLYHILQLQGQNRPVSMETGPPMEDVKLVQ